MKLTAVNDKKVIVSFSGGKDSTCMLLMMLEKGMQVDYILFCDTGLEFPQMYDHVQKVDEYIQKTYGKSITYLKPLKSFEYYLLEKEKTRGKYKGNHGYGWSSPMNRWCTSMLKTAPVKRFMREHSFTSKNSIMCIGIAKDEPKRIRDKCYPLVDFGVTEEKALEYCYAHGFDWGGLYKERKRLSCWICPLQHINDLRLLYRNFPKLWNRLKELNDKVIKKAHEENNILYEFRQMTHTDRTLAQWEERFKKELEEEENDETANTED